MSTDDKRGMLATPTPGSGYSTKISRRYLRNRRNNGHPGTRVRSKHMRRWSIVVGGVQTEMRSRHIGGTGQVAVESKATARRPWTVKAENRARNKRARAARRKGR